MIKKYIFPLTLLVSTLISCSNEESTTTNPENENLIKTYKVSRDSNGKYTVDYNLVEGAYVELNKDVTDSSNEAYVFEGKKTSANKSSNELELENNRISLDIFENNEQRRTITVEDKKIVMNKGGENSNFLQEYSVESLGADQYVLDFLVRKGINVTFEYNDEENIYEVHLKEGVSNGNSFTKLYQKSESLPLRIDFVNHIKLDNISEHVSKSRSAYEIQRIPRYGVGIVSKF